MFVQFFIFVVQYMPHPLFSHQFDIVNFFKNYRLLPSIFDIVMQLYIDSEAESRCQLKSTKSRVCGFKI